MKEKLIKLLNNSYSPYSNYRVAAIVRMKDGKEFSGVNIENSSYGACICAERSAIASSISSGYKKGDFDKLYVMCGDSNKISTCCFIENDEIICMDKLGNELKLKVKDLCPYPFTEDDLK